MIHAHVQYLRNMSHFHRTGMADPTMIYVEDSQMMSEVARICRESYKRPDTAKWVDNDTVRMSWKYDVDEGHGQIAGPRGRIAGPLTERY